MSPSLVSRWSRPLILAAAGCLALGAVASAQQPPAPPRFAPSLESLQRHQVPEWFHDAKLGIFIHWGLFSVPAWAPPTGELGTMEPVFWFKNNPYAEWYLNTIHIQGSPSYEHHVKTYGEKFDYLDFSKDFNRETARWDPAAWGQLFQESGARYVVLVTKHHDGFTLWPSGVRNPHRKPELQGSKRDLVGELTDAVRARGMKMGLYYSGGLDWSFGGLPITSEAALRAAVPQTEEYANYADAQWRELIRRYRPSVLWNDISYPRKSGLLNIVADYYNEVPEGVVDDRFGIPFSDFTTPEYAKYDKITEKKWEATRGLGYSFGYNQAEGPEHVLTSEQLIHLLVDVVSKNGNLLLNIGPKPDGSISQIQLDRLHSLGQWLKVNGEAIYATRPWVRPSGKTTAGLEVRFTRKGDTVYAILLGKPKSSRVTVEALMADEATTIQLLGVPGVIAWSQSGRNLSLALPENLPESEAYALKISPAPWKLVRE